MLEFFISIRFQHEHHSNFYIFNHLRFTLLFHYRYKNLSIIFYYKEYLNIHIYSSIIVYGKEDDVEADAEIDDEGESVLRSDETVPPANDILVRSKENQCENITNLSIIFRKEKKMKTLIAFHHRQISVLFMFLFNQQKQMVCYFLFSLH